jgi:predicted peptidase
MRFIFIISFMLVFVLQAMAQQIEYRSSHYNYLLYLPEHSAPENGFPLLIFLHGRGETGDNLNLVKKHGPPSFLDDTMDFPFMVVSPQCPEGKEWKPKKLRRLLEEIKSRSTVDPNRIYLTGLSMGGTGVWRFALRYPEIFAAMAPICGKIETKKACSLKDLPVWVFHGALDKVYPHTYSDEFVEALEACGGDVQYTLYPEVDHFAWVPAYKDPDLFKWFLMQRKSHE